MLVVWLTLRYVAESRDGRPRSFDIGGQLLFMVTVGSLAEAVIEGPKMGWGSPFILALFAVAVVGLCVFVWFERRSADPMMDLTLFRDRAYALAIATICVVFFSVYGMLLLTTQYLQNVRGYPPETTGLIILPFSGLITIVSPFIGRLVGKFGARPLILFGLATLMLGLFGLILGGSGSVVCGDWSDWRCADWAARCA